VLLRVSGLQTAGEIKTIPPELNSQSIRRIFRAKDVHKVCGKRAQLFLGDTWRHFATANNEWKAHQSSPATANGLVDIDWVK